MHEPILDALRRGAPDQAVAAARQAVAADATDARALGLLALALRAMGDNAEALDAVDRAIALAPDDAGLHFQRAGLLIGGRDLDAARQALTDTLKLDPNRLGAYVIQAELAIGRGDLDEAERLARIARRIDPEHAGIAAVEGMVALGRGDATGALQILRAAQLNTADDGLLLNALGFAYMANGHHAFAEQSFRALRERNGDNPAVRRLLAALAYQQKRPADALDEIAPLLGEGAQAPHGDLRQAGELALTLGRLPQALGWLRRALALQPSDARTLDLLMAAWRQQGDGDDATRTLEAALATAPDIDQLWRARFALVRGDLAQMQAVHARWQAACPQSPAMLDARLFIEDTRGDSAAAEATLNALAAQAPDDLNVAGRLFDALLQRDPAAARAHVQALLARAPDDGRQVPLRSWLAEAEDANDDPAAAVAGWSALHAEAAERLIPLPVFGPAQVAALDASTEPAAADAPQLAFLAGLPGSGVDRIARLLAPVVPAFRGDRFGPRPPADPLQNLKTVPGLVAGTLDAAAVADGWRAGLASRGLGQGDAVIDWLLWWDNSLLQVIGTRLPQARIVLALRDPRDMLLNWLAFGSPVPLRLSTPDAAATWLAEGLAHVQTLQGADALVTVLRLDETFDNPQALATQVGQALGMALPTPPDRLFGERRFPAGYWRRYAGVLEAAFARLTPVAVGLGYPES